MKRLDDSELKNDTGTAFGDIVDEPVYYNRCPHLRMAYNLKAKKSGWQKLVMHNSEYSCLRFVVCGDESLDHDIMDSFDLERYYGNSQKEERVHALLELLSIRSAAPITTAGRFPDDFEAGYAVTARYLKKRKPGRAASAVEPEEAKKITDREEDVSAWVATVFEADVSSCHFIKRNRELGQHYLLTLLDCFCFNKGDAHTSNATFVVVRIGG